MASINIVIAFEMDAVHDAICEIEIIRERLAKRHGEAFRALDRQIENLPAAPMAPPRMHMMDSGVIIFEAPREFVDIIRRARALGVI